MSTKSISPVESGRGPAGSAAPGYQRKPLWIYAIAAIMILEPALSATLTFIKVGLPWYRLSSWELLASRLPGYIWFMIAMSIGSGIALLRVRKVTWIMAVATFALLTGLNFVMLGRIVPSAIFIGLILLAKPLRRPFLNARLRWWETAKRYAFSLNVSIPTSGMECKLVNLSLTGALLEEEQGAEHPLVLGQRFQLALPSNGPELQGEVVRRDDERVGVKFLNMSGGQRRALRKWIAREQGRSPNNVYAPAFVRRSGTDKPSKAA